MPSRTIPGTASIDLKLTLRPLKRGGRDAAMRFEPGRVWRATRTPEGPGTARYSEGPDAIEVVAWGPGAEWLLETAPALLGLDDDPGAFRPEDRLLRRLHIRFSRLRFGRSHSVVEFLVPTILEQKVSGHEARESYRRLVWALGEPAPGPRRMMVPPSAEVLAALPYYELHRFGIERKRADIIRRASAAAPKLEAVTTMSHDDAMRRLMLIPGIGPWTAAQVVESVMGNPDSVRTGDLHLPHLVGWVFDKEPRSSDERMLELLEPYRGQRARVARYIEIGCGRPPRIAPRARLRKIGAI